MQSPLETKGEKLLDHDPGPLKDLDTVKESLGITVDQRERDKFLRYVGPKCLELCLHVSGV